MEWIRGHGVGKEKLAFAAVVPLLIACTFYYIGTCPGQLIEARAITSSEPPPTYCEPAPPPPSVVSNSRESPFGPIVYKPPPPPPSAVVVPGPVPPPAVVSPSTPRTTVPKPEALHINDPPVQYMGVVGLRGQTYGLLKVDDGTFRRVTEGQVLDDLGCSVVEIQKLAIHVMSNNRLYVRKNDRFWPRKSSPPATPQAGR